MKYGLVEFRYAEAFANALADDSSFRSWVISKTKFVHFALNARLLNEEMWEKRSKSASTWWRSHFTGKCLCDGCRGQETDILAIFEAERDVRFGLHIEVKQPKDKFALYSNQAANYGLRAKCWAASAPLHILPHTDAATILLCSAEKLGEYANHSCKFGSVITFESISKEFPNAVPQAVR